jgi:hypothetical protein
LVTGSRYYSFSASAACDRWHEEHLIAILEGVGGASEETDILLIHLNIEEAASLSRFIPQVRLQVGELRVEFRKEFTEVGGGAGNARRTGGKPSQGCWNLYGDAHE